MNTRVFFLPAYVFIIIANVVPIYGAIIGKLFFFQILYLYWFESLLLIFFDNVRIAMARGSESEAGMFGLNAGIHTDGPYSVVSRVTMMLKHTIVKVLLLCFYLLFIVLFIGFQLTGKEHQMDMMQTLVFRNAYFNTSVWLFLISMTVQLLGGFIFNGTYKRVSPVNYCNYFDRRTILIHVMTVLMVFVHQFFFEHKSYASKGEIVYIAIFSFAKTIMDLASYRKELKRPHEVVLLI